MSPARLLVFSIVVAPVLAHAQPAPRPGSDTSATAKNEATVLVPPQGGTADVPVRFSTNVMLSFPSTLAAHAIQSSPDWDVKAYAGATEVFVRPQTPKAAPTTLALAAKDGTIKVNISLRVVPETADGLTLVRFQSSTAEEAFRAAVDAEVAKVRAASAAELAAVRREQAEERRTTDARIAASASALLNRRLLARLESRSIKAHERNGDNVIVHGERIVLVGDEAHFMFQIENRSGSAYRLATVKVLDPAGADRAGDASLVSSSTTDPEGGILGIVPAGTTGRASVIIRQPDAILGKPLKLVVEEPGGRGRIVVARGIVVR
jgi:hypothetical protein